jgi:hypothetical protein
LLQLLHECDDALIHGVLALSHIDSGLALQQQPQQAIVGAETLNHSEVCKVDVGSEADIDERVVVEEAPQPRKQRRGGQQCPHERVWLAGEEPW